MIIDRISSTSLNSAIPLPPPILVATLGDRTSVDCESRALGAGELFRDDDGIERGGEKGVGVGEVRRVGVFLPGDVTVVVLSLDCERGRTMGVPAKEGAGLIGVAPSSGEVMDLSGRDVLEVMCWRYGVLFVWMRRVRWFSRQRSGGVDRGIGGVQ